MPPSEIERVLGSWCLTSKHFHRWGKHLTQRGRRLVFKDWEGEGTIRVGENSEFSGPSAPLLLPSLFLPVSLSLSLPYSSFLPVPSSSSPPPTNPLFYPLTSSPPISPRPPLHPGGAGPCLPSQLKGALKQEDPGQPAGPSHRSAFPLHLGWGCYPIFMASKVSTLKMDKERFGVDGWTCPGDTERMMSLTER